MLLRDSSYFKTHKIIWVRGLTMYRLVSVIIILLSITSIAYGEAGLSTIKSPHSVMETMDRLESSVQEKGMQVFVRIDHAKGAQQTGQELRPTELLIFGNPKAGTPLMQCQQQVAIDLPQKILVWEDTDGQVWLTYNDPGYLARRHSISGCDEVLEKISQALNNLAKNATAP
jgi:uncharacterized protein (DUF302 family)